MLSLRARLVLVNVLVFFLTFVVLVGVLSSQLISQLYEQLDQELAVAGGRALDHLVFVNGAFHLRETESRLLGNLGEGAFLRVLDGQGKIVDGVGEYQMLAVAPGSLSSVETGTLTNQTDIGGGPVRVYTRPLLASFAANKNVVAGYIQVASVPEEVLETISQIRRSLLIATPLALLVVGLAGFWAARKALQPLAEMTQSAAAISADSLAERRLPIPQAKDEVQALALAFNATLERLAAAFARQRRFTADASHELRTPITAIRGQTELALSRPRSAEAYQATLVRIEDEAERMQRLVSRMLTLARAESGQQILEFAATDVAALLQTLADTTAARLEARPVTLTLHSPPTLTVVTDADSLTQIVLNLLENAIAYTEEGEIAVEMTVEQGFVRIQVSDSGPGIDPASLEQVFEPFFRADPSRQHQSGGVGLGLALAHELTHLLGGKIAARNRPEGGASFSVILPVEPPSHSLSA